MGKKRRIRSSSQKFSKKHASHPYHKALLRLQAVKEEAMEDGVITKEEEIKIAVATKAVEEAKVVEEINVVEEVPVIPEPTPAPEPPPVIKEETPLPKPTQAAKKKPTTRRKAATKRTSPHRPSTKKAE